MVQAQLIRDCISLPHDEGLCVHSLIFDGTYTNQYTAKQLGCRLTVNSFQSWFPHPTKVIDRLHVIFDACHMLKLMWNLLADYEEITYIENGQLYRACWKYIVELNTVQENTGFKLGTKLKEKHIAWTKYKMNVSMAAQTLSSSVADAIEFLSFGMQMNEFDGSYGTVKFIRKIDMAFDMLNSMNPCDTGAKKPVTNNNLDTWQKEALSLANFIFELKDSYGRLLHNSPCKTAIWGFTVSSCSMAELSQHLLKHPVAPFGYILTYKFSQDHLELLFNKIRRRCSWNNNPDVLQFKYALRAILLQNSIKPSKTGNCTPFDDVFKSSLIDFKRRAAERHHKTSEDTDREIIEAEEMAVHLNDESQNDLLDNILCYIAGFIVKNLMKVVQCTNCHEEMLIHRDDPHGYSGISIRRDHLFSLHKQRGGIIIPSSAVLKIIKRSEAIFKRRVIESTMGITSERNLDLKRQSEVLAQVGTNVFKNIGNHYADHHIGEGDHLTSLLRMIIMKYITIWLKSYGIDYTQMVAHKNIPSTRHLLTKSVIFSGQ